MGICRAVRSRMASAIPWLRSGLSVFDRSRSQNLGSVMHNGHVLRPSLRKIQDGSDRRRSSVWGPIGNRRKNLHVRFAGVSSTKSIRLVRFLIKKVRPGCTSVSLRSPTRDQ